MRVIGVFKLYKKDETGHVRAYYEVWAEPARRRIIEHWGAVGEPGETEVHRIWFFGSLEAQFEKIIAPARAQGFEELPRGDFQTLIVRATSAEDISDEADDFADRLNEVMGWNGLGICQSVKPDGHGILAECDTVDLVLCERVLADTFEGDPGFESYKLTFERPEAD